MASLIGQCEVCRGWTRGGLCPDCRGRFAGPQPRCARCAARTALPLAMCGECLAEPPPFAACIAVADYGFPWDRLLSAFKFHGRVELAAPLAGCLDDALVRVAGTPAVAGMAGTPAVAGVSLVIPVPLADARLRERGYNQAWELARRLARRRGLAARADLLLRGRDTTHQIGLARADRLRNLRHAFMVLPTQAAEVAGRHVALVDDVLTTGATAASAAAALRAAGALSVQVWVVARTPAPGG